MLNIKKLAVLVQKKMELQKGSMEKVVFHREILIRLNFEKKIALHKPLLINNDTVYCQRKAG